MARRALLSEYRKGRLARHQVCDAPQELLRNAEALGTPTSVPCPVCAEQPLVLVTYVFGPRMPASGRCISRPGELAQLNRRAEVLSGYVVEVCTACRWHHLIQTFPLGGNARRRRSGAPG
jgi:hypothetical protein